MNKKMISNRKARMAFRFRKYLQNPFCYWCGEWMLVFCEHATLEDLATIEHVIPKRCGGTDKNDNLELAHKRCNKKADGRIKS